MVARPPARNPTEKNHIGRDVVFFISFFLLLHTSEVYTNKHNPPRMATHCDKDILEAFDHNPQEGFGLLLERFQQPLYWHIRRLVVSHLDTEDITQEVFEDIRGVAQVPRTVVAHNVDLPHCHQRGPQVVEAQQAQGCTATRQRRGRPTSGASHQLWRH